MLLDRALECIRDSNARVYVACSGAGAGLPGLLWALPGCSSFFVGASFPYAADATDEFLRFTPGHYCTPETAIDLATEAFLRAGASSNAIGVGLTASVASTRVHRGEHRVHAAWVSATGAGAHDLVLAKGSGREDRKRDGELADHAGLNALLDALGKPGLAGHPTREHLVLDVPSYVVSNRDDMARSRFFERPYFGADGARSEAPSTLAAALPGTFDPPHAGHLGLADAFAAQAGVSPVFWVTAEPPHKPQVPLGELLRRARLLLGRAVLFTRGEPLYLDKARAYPGCSFVIGADALARMFDPAWGPSVEGLVAEFRRLRTRFHVANRVVSGALLTLDDIPAAPRDLCVALPGRWDLSSTELRRAG